MSFQTCTKIKHPHASNTLSHWPGPTSAPEPSPPTTTHTQARAYIADSLGDQYAEGVILDVEKMCIETECRTPLVGLLSMGSDPTASIEQLAKKLKTG